MDNQNIKIKGNSGCKITIVNKNNSYSLIKTSKDVPYSTRLERQGVKQQEFKYELDTLNKFRTPEIHKTWTEDGLFNIEMEYINADSFINYFSKANKNNLDGFLTLVTSYLKTNYDGGSSISIESIHKIILSKINELRQIFESITWIDSFRSDLIQYLLNGIPKFEFQIGVCHGDLTLSNMLFTKSNNIYLIDFLDSFIESPIIDFIKLKQDTKYFWSLNITDLYDTRTIQTLGYIDKHLDNLKPHLPLLLYWESYLTILNFARIIPYAHTERDHHFLRTNIIHNLKQI